MSAARTLAIDPACAPQISIRDAVEVGESREDDARERPLDGDAEKTREDRPSDGNAKDEAREKDRPLDGNTEKVEHTSDTDVGTSNHEASTRRKKDVLKWFGILTPAALRTAQASSVRLVTEAVPRVVDLDIQLRELEIDIRRARKRQLKDAARKEKERGREEGTEEVKGVHEE
jgi:hypothetical protein